MTNKTNIYYTNTYREARLLAKELCFPSTNGKLTDTISRAKWESGIPLRVKRIITGNFSLEDCEILIYKESKND